MRYRADLRSERGIALIVVLLVVLAIAAIAAGAAVLGSNTSLINKYHQKLSVLETTADAGLEEARSAINGSKLVYPDTGYKTLENGVAVYSASGALIPNVKRWTYVGPTGVTTGQYGVFGSVVVVTQDGQGNRLVRRGEIYQESFAKFAYFTDVEAGIQFGADQLYGPVHSNDVITIWGSSPKPIFNGWVTTAKTIANKTNATFVQNPGYTEKAPIIPFPTTADLTKLKNQALAGGTAITSTTAGNEGQATTRIEFVALDLDADTDSTDSDEGFMKIYQVANTANAWWVVADTFQYNPAGGTGVSKERNCGHSFNPPAANSDHGTAFRTFRHHKTAGVTDVQNWAVLQAARSCHLGGSDILNDWTTPTAGAFLSGVNNGAAVWDSMGKWLPWTGVVDPRVTAVRPADAAYLWPLSRALNANFKGVIHVEGKVAISGRLRGQVTLAATNNIIIVDDIRYVSNPGVQPPACDSRSRDILGLFSGTDVVVADNLINNPISPNNSGTLLTWDPDGPNEDINGVVLALDNFTVQNFGNPPGPNATEKCGTTNWGRGCLNLVGGIIQKQRGPVGLGSGEGNLKRYQYDNCAGTNPPPYFPTTGHFVRGHYYEVEPTGFSIVTYWPELVPKP
jgi:hypothetical protein